MCCCCAQLLCDCCAQLLRGYLSPHRCHRTAVTAPLSLSPHRCHRTAVTAPLSPHRCHRCRCHRTAVTAPLSLLSLSPHRCHCTTMQYTDHTIVAVLHAHRQRQRRRHRRKRLLLAAVVAAVRHRQSRRSYPRAKRMDWRERCPDSEEVRRTVPMHAPRVQPDRAAHQAVPAAGQRQRARSAHARAQLAHGIALLCRRRPERHRRHDRLREDHVLGPCVDGVRGGVQGILTVAP
eukprot:COSAG01_NODE_3495_length_6009_cov_3.944839_2_plen_234_part_00